MTTDQHREKARKVTEQWRFIMPRLGVGKLTLSQWAELEQRIAAALSSRDTEIREVLEGLITHVDFDDGGNPIRHWCAVSDDGDSECDNACLAARGLWERVQG